MPGMGKGLAEGWGMSILRAVKDDGMVVRGSGENIRSASRGDGGHMPAPRNGEPTGDAGPMIGEWADTFVFR